MSRYNQLCTLERLPEIFESFKVVSTLKEWKNLSSELNEMYNALSPRCWLGMWDWEALGCPDEAKLAEYEELYEITAQEKTRAINRIRPAKAA